MSIKKIRNDFLNHLIYIQLMSSLDPGEGNITGPIVNPILIELHEFYKNSNTKEFKEKGPRLLNTLEPLVNNYKRIAPLKLPFEVVTSDFNKLLDSDRDPYVYGIDYCWLDTRMDCSSMGFPSDLPWHTRIGLGNHAGRVSIEEEFLLRDAFYLLELAEESFINLNVYGDEINKYGQKDIEDGMTTLTLLNYDVGLYSRLCIVNFFSFIEAFINSVGYDYYLRNQYNLSPENIEILNGKKNNRYLSLESKIEKYPSIIREDKLSPIIISDPSQLKEPFKTFIYSIKAIRDSSMHYAPSKEPIWQKPLDWLENVRNSSRLCIDVAREFWISCYPSRGQPGYLHELNYDIHISMAKKRIKARNDSMTINKKRQSDT